MWMLMLRVLLLKEGILARSLAGRCQDVDHVRITGDGTFTFFFALIF
jgi:hypothetical protein